MEKVNIGDNIKTIEYKNVKIGDIIYDKNTKTTYIADLWDADEAKWVVID